MENVDGGIPLNDTDTARCFGCRNRFGLVALVVLDCGVLCCRRCAERRELLLSRDMDCGVEVVG